MILESRIHYWYILLTADHDNKIKAARDSTADFQVAGKNISTLSPEDHCGSFL